MLSFDWVGDTKPISSFWIGSTPEMELALYAICYLYAPGQDVPVSMNGKIYKIQTYIRPEDPSLVASSFPDIDI